MTSDTAARRWTIFRAPFGRAWQVAPSTAERLTALEIVEVVPVAAYDAAVVRCAELEAEVERVLDVLYESELGQARSGEGGGVG